MGAGWARQVVGRMLLTAGAAMWLAGCGQFKPKVDESYVYVTAKQGFLRDRVAAVSNRVAQVQNGDKLKVLDHGRHFLKVQTAAGQVGWIEERSVATPQTAAAFDDLKAQHQGDPEIAGGVTRDQVYMHLKPGRDTDRFYLLPEGEKLRLLKRAIVVKVLTQMTSAKEKQKAIPEAVGTHAVKKGAVAAAPEEAPATQAMEDWWLVRDSQGHTGWLFGRNDGCGRAGYADEVLRGAKVCWGLRADDGARRWSANRPEGYPGVCDGDELVQGWAAV